MLPTQQFVCEGSMGSGCVMEAKVEEGAGKLSSLPLRSFSSLLW